MNVQEYHAVAHKLANRRMKGTPHGDLIKAVVQRLCLKPGVDVIQMNTGALKGIGQDGKERLIRFGYPGMADLFVRVSVGTRCAPRYVVLWMECKIPPDKQSDAQVAFQQQTEKWGDLYRIVRTIEDAQRIIEEVKNA